VGQTHKETMGCWCSRSSAKQQEPEEVFDVVVTHNPVTSSRKDATEEPEEEPVHAGTPRPVPHLDLENRLRDLALDEESAEPGTSSSCSSCSSTSSGSDTSPMPVPTLVAPAEPDPASDESSDPWDIVVSDGEDVPG